MSLVNKVMALMAMLKREDLESLCPIERQRFSDLCKFLANLADQSQYTRKSSVLIELDRYRRDE